MVLCADGPPLVQAEIVNLQSVSFQTFASSQLPSTSLAGEADVEAAERQATAAHAVEFAAHTAAILESGTKPVAYCNAL